MAGEDAARSLRCTRVSCTANASSHLSRRRARYSSSLLDGRWISRSAVPMPTSFRPARIDAGSGSSGGVTVSSTTRTQRAITQVGTAAAAG